MFEGAQGTLLDIDHGTYPFVTSSNASAGGVCTGLGVPPRAVGTVLGVVKAYTTRVGEGPLPTELLGEMGNRLRESGQEYGASTGRPRRCGWYDAVAVRFSARVSGIDALALTKLDVLDGLESISLCTGYRCGGAVHPGLPGRPEPALQLRADLRGAARLERADARRPVLRRPAARSARPTSAASRKSPASRPPSSPPARIGRRRL